MTDQPVHVGIVAPAAPVEPERFDRCVSVLTSNDIEVSVFGDPTAHYASEHGAFSSDWPEARAEALQQAFDSPEVTHVLAAKGGYGSLELLGKLDFSKLVAARKPLVGFSDLTVLLAAFVEAGGVGWHAGTLEFAFARHHEGEAYEETGNYLLEALKFGGDGGSNPALLEGEASVLRPGSMAMLEQLLEVSAPIRGGNITSLASMAGTPRQPSFADRIVVLEEIGESPYRLHRCLTQMRLAGMFNDVSAIVFGYLTNCYHPKGVGMNYVEAVLDALKYDTSFPVLHGLQCGHEHPNRVLHFGPVNFTLRERTCR